MEQWSLYSIPVSTWAAQASFLAQMSTLSTLWMAARLTLAASWPYKMPSRSITWLFSLWIISYCLITWVHSSFKWRVMGPMGASLSLLAKLLLRLQRSLTTSQSNLSHPQAWSVKLPILKSLFLQQFQLIPPVGLKSTCQSGMQALSRCLSPCPSSRRTHWE